MGLDSQIRRGIKVLERARRIIPADILRNAKGLCVMAEAKGAFLFSGAIGRGFLIERTSDGLWGYPSSVMSVSVGVGGQIGAEIVDIVLVINDESTLKAMEGKLQVRLGGDISVAMGPIGSDARGLISAGTNGSTAVYSYSLARGAFVGVALEGAVLAANVSANKTFYKGSYAVKDILRAKIELKGQAINTIEGLAGSLFSLEEEQVGRGVFNVVPVDEDEYDKATRDASNFEKRKSNRCVMATVQHTCKVRTEWSDSEVTAEEFVADLESPSHDMNMSQYEFDSRRQSEILHDEPGWFEKRVATGATLVVTTDHIVDESEPRNAKHFIISVKKGQDVILVEGDREKGLPAPYEDYVSVYVPSTYKAGRVSKFVLEPYSTNPFI